MMFIDLKQKQSANLEHIIEPGQAISHFQYFEEVWWTMLGKVSMKRFDEVKLIFHDTAKSVTYK